MKNIIQPPWMIRDEFYNKYIADKEIMLKILEQEATKLKNKGLSDVGKDIGKYDYWKNKLDKNKQYQKALEDTYNAQEYYPCESIIDFMPDKYKEKKEYTQFIDNNLEKLYGRWNSVGSIGATQMMLVYHPIREIKMLGLEILLAYNIGDRSSDDLSCKMCEMTNCRFIVTEYIDQEYHGYRQNDPYCPSHGNLLYNDDLRFELREKWNRMIKEMR